MKERQAALDAVLNSTALARSEQLRNFLRYVGELEIAGRGGEISEYSIGVNALNRPPGFSPSEDSTVRTRAHLLRQKLQEIYDRELADTKLRVDLPRGSYVPRFTIEEPKAELASSETGKPAVYPISRLVLIAALSLLLGVSGTVLVFRWITPFTSRVDPLIRQAWGPLVASNASVMICVSNPVQLTVRPLNEAPTPPWYSPFPPSEELLARFAKIQPSWKHANLFLEFSENSTRFGESLALAQASRILGIAGAQTEVLATRSIHAPAFSGRNLILLGTPEFSGVARNLLSRAAFTVTWDAKNRDLAVVETPSASGTAHSFLPVRSGGGRGTVDISYGLLTVLPSEGSAGGRHRTVIISGTTSAGSHGAMEYFASVPSLDDLRNRLRAEGITGFPPAYQVVVRCSTASDHLRSFQYAAHRVLDPQSLIR